MGTTRIENFGFCHKAVQNLHEVEMKRLFDKPEKVPDTIGFSVVDPADISVDPPRELYQDWLVW